MRQKPPQEAPDHRSCRQDNERISCVASNRVATTIAQTGYRHGQEAGERDLGQLQRRRLIKFSNTNIGIEDRLVRLRIRIRLRFRLVRLRWVLRIEFMAAPVDGVDQEHDEPWDSHHRSCYLLRESHDDNGEHVRRG